MSSAEQNEELSSIKQLRQALERIPGGVEAVRLMTRLGLWSADAHKNPRVRTSFPRQFSDLGPNELADLSAATVSEAGRLMELVGVLSGLQMQLKLKEKSARAASRARSRRNWPEDKKSPTKAELDDLAEEDVQVVTVEGQLGILGLLLSSAKAALEAQVLYKESVSREISHRGAQMQARIF